MSSPGRCSPPKASDREGTVASETKERSRPELNVVINDQDSGQWLSDSDFVWRGQRVVAEFDGDHHRTDRQQWQNGVARRENLQDDGWAFVQLTTRR